MMEVGAFAMPTVAHKTELRKGLAGTRTDLYQTMLDNLVELSQYMDGHGYYGMGFTEHHFHIEGGEISTNPVLLDLFLGSRTRNMKFGQLGNVMPQQHPIRLAEDIAILDQMTKGRAFAGFARGYQNRWLNTMGQQYPGLASDADPAAWDRAKQELYEEHVEIVLKALTNTTFSHKGKQWQIPPPGIKWPAAEYSRKFGQGIDENGIVQEIGIAPPPYNKKLPDLFQPFTFSEKALKFGMEHGLVPISLITDPERAVAQFRQAQVFGAVNGVNLKFGEKVGISREVIVADTEEKAEELARNAMTYLWIEFFAPFGFNGAFVKKGEDVATLDANTSFEMLVDRGMVIHGTPSTVNRKLEALFKMLPCEYFWNFAMNELIPHKDMMRSWELQTEKVWPNFTDKIS